MTRDWTKIAKEYAKSATMKSTRHKFGKWARLACKRFLDDLERTKLKDCPFYYSDEEAGRVCEFISALPHVEGKWATENIELCGFQIFFLCNLFGFRNKDGTRRFTSALLAIARKNAKSSLAAGIGLYCLTMEDETGPQVITAATTGDQARIVFNVGKRMVDKTPDLREACSLQAFTRAIACYSNGGVMKAINAKASTQDGLNPSCSIMDEIHAHKTHDLLNVLQSAAGARRNPLFLFTTTEGYESPGPWPEHRRFAQQVLEGVVTADHFFAVIYAIDDEDKDAKKPADDEFDEKVWIKANPLMESNPLLLAAIKKDAIDAKAMPGRHSEFLIKRVNRQSSTANGWIDLQKWKLCAGDVPLDELRDHPCYGGLDLASTRDITSFRLVWIKDFIIYTKGWRWVPKTTVEMRARRNLVPYAGWVKSGHLIATPGEVTDYDVVFKQVVDARRDFKLVKVGYDRWNAAQIAAKLSAAGVEMHEFIQGPKSYHPVMKFFEESYYSRNFRHGGDPVLTWCAANLISRNDQNMNNAPDRKKSADKIDDIVALFMGIGAALAEEPQEDINAFINSPLVLR